MIHPLSNLSPNHHVRRYLNIDGKFKIVVSSFDILPLIGLQIFNRSQNFQKKRSNIFIEYGYPPSRIFRVLMTLFTTQLEYKFRNNFDIRWLIFYSGMNQSRRWSYASLPSHPSSGYMTCNSTPPSQESFWMTSHQIFKNE